MTPRTENVTRTYTTPMPGHITVTPAMVRATLPGIDARITAHITAWAAAVPVGTRTTVFRMLVHDVTCACPPDAWVHLKTCRGFAHGMPLEIVLEHLFPPDDTPCAIAGVTGYRRQGPLEPHALALPAYVERTS